MRFAARRNYANLAVLKDVERAIGRALDVVVSSDSEVRSKVEALRAELKGFDDLSSAAKQTRVAAALAIVDGGAAASTAGHPRHEQPSGLRTDPSTAGHPRHEQPSGLRTDPSTAGHPRHEQPSGLRTDPSPPAPSKTKQRSANKKSLSSTPVVSDRAANAELPSGRELFLAAPRVPPADIRRRVSMDAVHPDYPLSVVVGIGPKTAEKLAARDILTVQDALFYFPSKYEDRTQVRTIESLRPGDKATVQGVIAASALRNRGRRRLWEMALRDGTGVLSVRFFRFSQRDLEGRYPVGTRVRVFGAVTFFGAQRQMAHPELELVRDDDPPPTGFRPVYPEVDGVPPRTLQRILQSLAESAADKVFDPLPDGLRERLQLAPLTPAVRAAHIPDEGDGGAALRALRRRLAFDELLYLQLALSINRSGREEEPGLAQELGDGWRPLAERALPFEPTRAQARVLDEISVDLAAPHPMSRLLQGDVGSGKTAVALLAAAMLAHGKRQACLLAPTEILAQQHAKSAQTILGKLGLQSALLTGSTTPRARRALIRALKRGDVQLIIGTHALLEPDVEFADLGLVLIDEQHRFGVEQRAKLLAKRPPPRPDVLVMTATPIPRTLTLSLYGDLRVSVIDELPPGRTPTQTRIYGAQESEKAYREVRRTLDEGQQAYVVFPLVEASDQLDLKSATEAVEELSQMFAPHTVELLHGKMKSEEKSSVMGAFARAQISVLVATTVIEVGVDVPNASVIVVEEADRFGLSQLHQLRGRVGRGRHAGRCFLIAGKTAGSDARERLSVMAETTDGFLIAQRDLEIRGPGEVLGTRQSGLPDLVLADLVSDGALIELARTEAEHLLKDDPHLNRLEHVGIRRELHRRFGGKLARIDAG